MPYCINCAFFIPPEKKSGLTDLKLGHCRRRMKYHPVDGEPMYYDAWDERMALGTCGPEGRHFVQIVPSTYTSHSDVAAEEMQSQEEKQ
jgi:hypothetical protein